MAMAQHRLLAWIWQPTATDPRVGFVEMSRADFLAAGARAQDPRVGGLVLKHITNDVFVPTGPAPLVEASSSSSSSSGASSARRRRSAPATEG